MMLDFAEKNSAERANITAQLEAKIQQNTSEFAYFAKLHLAGLALREKDYLKANECFRFVIDAKSAPALLSDYAKIMLVSIALDHPEVIAKVELDKYIKDLDSANTAFIYNAKIIKSLYFIKENKIKEAQEILASILNSQEVPDVFRVQAAAIMDSVNF